MEVTEARDLAARLLKSGGGDVDIGEDRVLLFPDAAGKLARYVMENTPSNAPANEDSELLAQADILDQPLPDAPSPVLMRVEFINIITAHSGGKIGFNKAALMVDKIIARQMQYYAAMADPQMEADNREQLQIVMEAKGIIEALVRQAGASAEFMADRQLWIRTAARARELAAKMEAMFT